MMENIELKYNHLFRLLVALSLLIIAVLGVALPAIVAAQTPDPKLNSQPDFDSSFTYQGELTDNGGPVNNRTCDFKFSLWDAAGEGSQLGSSHTVGGLDVINGQLTVTLNESGQFGHQAFTGEPRWLQVAVRCPAGRSDYITLSPRQLLTAVPYAFSLRPGATILGNMLAEPLLMLENDGGTGLIGSTMSDNTSSSPTPGVLGWAKAGTGINYGVVGQSDSVSGVGVLGWTRAASGENKGVLGQSDSFEGTGVFGLATSAGGTSKGLYGLTVSTEGTGVVGHAMASSGENEGVFGLSESSSGTGVYGLALCSNPTYEKT